MVTNYNKLFAIMTCLCLLSLMVPSTHAATVDDYEHFFIKATKEHVFYSLEKQHALIFEQNKYKRISLKKLTQDTFLGVYYDNGKKRTFLIEENRKKNTVDIELEIKNNKFNSYTLAHSHKPLIHSIVQFDKGQYHLFLAAQPGKGNNVKYSFITK